MRDFTLDDLKQFNGKNGKPAYVAHQGRIYDVSGSPMWKDGEHMNRHAAGGDLTADMSAAPHESDKLAEFSEIGRLKPDTDQDLHIPAFLEKLLVKFPMLRRHPHPMTVHFPIAFLVVVPLFALLYLVSGEMSFELTALYCLILGLLSLVVATATGVYAWWIIYRLKPQSAVRIKQLNTIILAIVAALALVWRLLVPDVLGHLDTAGIIYMALLLLLPCLVGINGWFGASLTFPHE